MGLDVIWLFLLLLQIGHDDCHGRPCDIVRDGSNVTCLCWTASNIEDTWDDCLLDPVQAWDTTPPVGYALLSCGNPSTTSYLGAVTASTCQVSVDALNGVVPLTILSSEQSEACFAELVTAEAAF